jgi:arginase family enzyme
MEANNMARLGTYGNLTYVPDKEGLNGFDYAIFGVPYDFKSSHRPGGRKGPAYIRERSRIKKFDIKSGIDLSGAKGVDTGDVRITPGDEPGNTKKMTEKFQTLLESGTIPVVLGGDPSITYHEAKAFKEKYPDGIVVFISGHTRLHHLDEYPDSSSVVYSVIKDGLAAPADIVIIGTRDPLTSDYFYCDAGDGK